jgi:formylglycine-generating enzyme
MIRLFIVGLIYLHTILYAQERVNGHTLITVAAGDYTIGELAHPTNPLRKVSIKSFRMADTETTNEQFSRFIRETKYITDAERKGSAHIFIYGSREWKWIETKGACWRFPYGPKKVNAKEKLPTHPVTCISAADAMAYCEWAGGRLPSQTEWEIAARAGIQTRYPSGETFDSTIANTWNGATHKKNTMLDQWEFTAPVRSFPPNSLGFYDMIGNVFEFCADLPRGIKEKPRQPLTSARGGSWWCSASTCRAYNLVDNGTMPLHGSLPNQGFRIAFSNSN